MKYRSKTLKTTKIDQRERMTNTENNKAIERWCKRNKGINLKKNQEIEEEMVWEIEERAENQKTKEKQEGSSKREKTQEKDGESAKKGETKKTKTKKEE